MHPKEFFYDNYKNHPAHTLQRIAGEYAKLTPQAQEALRDVLKEREMHDLLATLDKEAEQKPSLAHLRPEEIRVMINARLDRGEKLEVIKADLQEQGVNIYDLSLQETRKEEEIEERFIELQRRGKTKKEIDAQLKKEFDLSEKDTQKIPERMHSTGAWYIVAGALLLLMCIPFLLVVAQTPGRHEIGWLIGGVGGGAGLLALGVRKRVAAQRFIKDAEDTQPDYSDN